MRLPGVPVDLPDPRALAEGLVSLPGLGGELLARVTGLLGRAERTLDEADGLVARIEETRRHADDLVARTEASRAQVDPLVNRMSLLADELPALVARLTALLDGLEPSLTTLQPTLERLAETTDAREVDALVAMVDRLPELGRALEEQVIPVMSSLRTVSPDIHDLLDTSRELNEMLAKLPGMGRVRKRVEEAQEAEQAGSPEPAG